MVSYMSFQNGKPVGAPKDVVTGFASSDQKGREPVTWTCGGRDLLSLHHLPVVRRRDAAIVRLAAGEIIHGLMMKRIAVNVARGAFTLNAVSTVGHRS